MYWPSHLLKLVLGRRQRQADRHAIVHVRLEIPAHVHATLVIPTRPYATAPSSRLLKRSPKHVRGGKTDHTKGSSLP